MQRQRLILILGIVGVLLIVSSAALLIWSVASEKSHDANAIQIVNRLENLMPAETEPGFPDGRSNTAMPAMEIDGESFVGVLEVFGFNVRLPIRSEWDKGKISQYPCLYSGSVYDSSLIIGGSDSETQLGFADVIDIGDRLQITDMEGNVFSYRVSNIKRSNDASTEKLTDADAALTLFVRDTYTLEYIIIRCNLN